MVDDEDGLVEIEYCHDLILIEVGQNPIKVIALIRELNHQNISLQEIKTMIENCPVKVADCLAKLQPSIWQKRFEDVGAKVDFKIY